MTMLDDQYWISQAKNAATKEVLQVALEQFEDLSSEEPTVWNARDYMEKEADNWLCAEYEGEDDEMWPSWVNLVCTPAINSTIDWELIHRAINERQNA